MCKRIVDANTCKKLVNLSPAPVSIPFVLLQCTVSNGGDVVCLGPT